MSVDKLLKYFCFLIIHIKTQNTYYSVHAHDTDKQSSQIDNDIQKLNTENDCSDKACCTGCLRCVNNECQICDFTKFQKINGKCVKIDLLEDGNLFQNCMQISPQGHCFRCARGYYLDSGKNCQKIQNLQEEHCIEYQLRDNMIQCVQCEKGYNLQQKQCIFVKTLNLIQNCELYENSKCVKCIRGYLPNIGGNQCILTPQQNCQSYAYVDCRQCKQCSTQNCNEKYVENPIGFIKDFFYSDSLEVFDLMFQTAFALKPKIMNHSFCIKLEDNCSKIDKNLECIQCDYGYFLQNKKCIQFYYSKIPNCLYDENQKCLMCNSDYFINQDYKCQLPSNIDTYEVQNCLTYEIRPSVKEKVCIQCLHQNSDNQLLYLKNNKCVVVEKIIQFCEQYVINYTTQQSECNSCFSGYILSQNKKQCLEEIQNCEQIGFQCGSNILSTCDLNCNQCKIYCSQCKPFFYLEIQSQKCQEGSIQNCKYYLTSTPENQQCIQCDNKYYLFQNNCLQHKEIEKCDIYHSTKKNVCEKGYENYYTVVKDSECQIDTNIEPDDFVVLKNQVDMCYVPIYNLGINDFQTCAVCEKDKLPFKYSNFTSCLKKKFVTQNIDKCTHYKQQEDKTYICYECQEGYVLNEDYKSCINMMQCAKTVSTILYLDNPFNFKALIVCKIQSDNSCFAGNEIRTLTHHVFQCLECKPGFLKKIDIAQRYAFDDAIEQYNDKDRYLINMGQYSHLNIKCQAGNVIENCHIYNRNNQCMQCKFGYQLQDNQCISGGQICQRETFIGYHAEFGSLYKCFCTNGQTSILKVEFTDTNQLSFDLTSYNIQVNASCVDMQIGIQNCYLIIEYFIPHININIYKCGACMPGYQPIYYASAPYLVKECIKIQFCAVTQSVNNCSNCQQNYGFLVKDEQIYGTCYPTIPNCYITDLNKKCQMCNIGYYLINDKCQKLDFNDCETDSSMVSKMYYLNYKNVMIPLVYQYDNYSFQGCLSCKIDFVAITKNQEGLVCSSVDQELNIIENCLYLKLDQNNKYECYRCKQGFTLYQNQCILQTQNCLVVQSVSYCQECLEGLVSDQGVCVVPEIKNCQEQYNKICNKCQQNYFLVNFRNNQQYCFRHEENCVNLDYDSSGSIPKIQCKQCNALEKLTSKTPESMFYQIDPIQNCIEYSLATYPLQSDVYCKKCVESQLDTNDLFYLDNGQCKQRDLDVLCLNYEQYENYCKQDSCKSGSFFSSLSKKCTSVPKIENCIEFLNFTTCKLCTSGYFLKDCKYIDQISTPDHVCFKNNLSNICQQVEAENKIQNCEIYDSRQNCTKCFDNVNEQYFLQDIDGKKTCVQSLAKNCKTQVNPLQCLKCFSGYYIKKQDEVLTCEINNNDNCIFYSEEYIEQKGHEALSGHCQYCENQYAVNNSNAKGKCEFMQSDQILDHCIYHEIYDNQIVCIQCQQNYSIYQGKCYDVQPMTIVNDYCETNFIIHNNAQPQCIFCKMGYYLQHETQKCISCESAGLLNCQICTVNSETKVCELCQFEYYMNEEKECLKNFYTITQQIIFLNTQK